MATAGTERNREECAERNARRGMRREECAERNMQSK